MFPHTYQVRDFAPKLATRFNQVLVSDIISVLCDEFEVERDVCASETLRFVAVLVDKQVLQV